MTAQFTRPGITPADLAPLAIADRSGFDESIHYGAAVALGSDGGVVAHWGNPNATIFPRSANKPMLADAMIALGADLTSTQAALVCASHDGTPRHVAVVEGLLAGLGLDASDLDNTHDLPLHKASAHQVLAAGGGRGVLTMNCSGKHAGMLAACCAAGWPIEGYLHPDHPLQVALTDHLADLAGGVNHIGVDGCGAPTHATSLVGLARAFRTLLERSSPAAAAMVAHPELVGGDKRDNTRLMRVLPGAIAKDGAEGIMAVALPDGCAVAVKVSDGNGRAAGVVAAAALAHVGVDIPDGTVGEPLLGHDKPVGTVTAAFVR